MPIHNKNYKPLRKQSGQYDKIIKENLDITLPVIIKELLGIEVAESEELPDDLQHTKERRPDALKKITDTKGNTFVLHAEFQLKDDPEMVYREADYCIMLMRKYRLPVRQFVIYLGEASPTMPTLLETERLTFSYDLVSISEAHYRMFLKSDNPEVRMLGLLANFGTEDSANVIREIVESVKSHTNGDFAESRFFKQMRIFVQLRSNIEHQFEKVMEPITKFFKEEKDYLYRKGEAKGERKERISIARAMKKDGIPMQQITKFTKLPIEEIEKL